ncbi:MAG: chaperone modulatory protein CbpM [Bacteroidia bacterium]|jgi:chaperone modulatory protein CbpM
MNTKTMRITVTELCECEGISNTVLLEMVEYEIAQPMAGSSIQDWIFDTTSAHWMRRAIRLQRDLEIDWLAVSILIDLLREREKLSRENSSLRQRLDRFLSQ